METTMTDLDHEAEALALADATLSAENEEALHGEEPQAQPQPGAEQPQPGAGQQQPGQQATGQVVTQQPEPRTADHVPLAVYLEQREQAKEYQRRLAQYEQQRQQPQQQQPDPFMHPDQFADSRIQAAVAPIISQLQAVVANNNLSAARAIHGQELADRAYQEFDKALPTMSPFEAAQVMQAQNPFVAAVEWHGRREILQQVGNDPNAYRERLLQEALQDPDFLARAREVISARIEGRQPQPTQQQTLPPRNEAGQFVAAPPARKLLPSVNRAGSGQQAMSAAPVALDDMELAEEILSMREEPT
jgi:hypothetical protein